MSESIFDHDRLDVYRLSMQYTSDAFQISKELSGLHRPARDQWQHAAQSIPLRMAEGNGKRSLKDRARFLDNARGSSFECTAIQDVLVASGGMEQSMSNPLKLKLKRIVSMLARMAMKFDTVSESPEVYTGVGFAGVRLGFRG